MVDARASNEVELPKDPAPPDPAGDWDVRSPEGLRRHLERVRAEGWAATSGREILSALPSRLRRAAAQRGARTGRPPSSDDLADLVSRAYEVLQEDADRVLAAVSPWAYVVRAAGNAAAQEDIATDRHIPKWLTHEGGRTPLPPKPTRLGATATDLSSLEVGQESPCMEIERVGMHHEDDFGEVLGLVMRTLTSRGAPGPITVAAVLRCTQLIAANGVSRRHQAARADEELLRLGLTSSQAAGLMSLLVGAQQGADPAESLLGAALRACQSGNPLSLSREVRGRVAEFVGAFPVEVTA